MSDGLLSPAVGGAMWLVSGAGAAVSVRRADRLHIEKESANLALMGVSGAFVFAAQMVSFAVPGTSSSAHIIGAVLLCALLGPERAFLTMLTVLSIQALFFADGGVLALGCNLFNMAFWSCFLIYPFLFRPIIRRGAGKARILVVSVLSCVLALQLGGLSAALEISASQVAALHLGTLLLLLLPIHLLLGVVEGAVTGAALIFLNKHDTRIFRQNEREGTSGRGPVVALAVLALAAGAGLSLLASTKPDWLAWSAAKAGVGATTATGGAAHGVTASLQRFFSFLPGYRIPQAGVGESLLGTALSGIVGIALAAALIVGIGYMVRTLRRRRRDGHGE